MATNVLKGDLIVLDLGSVGGGQLQIGTNGNDDKIFLEGFNHDGSGNAAAMLITGRFAKSLPSFTVLADTTRVAGGTVLFDLSPVGGGQLLIGCNQNDNKIFLEGIASELLITGDSAKSLPSFTVLADTTRVAGGTVLFDLSPVGGGQLLIGCNQNDNKIFLEGIASELLITGDSAKSLPLFSVVADTSRFFGDIETSGDIRLTNADCAEDFDICEREQIEPGTVMVLGQGGKLEQSHTAYDKRVAGVISGAGDYKPGIVLDKQQSQGGRQPVALLGKVFCKVDAQYGAIEVGDLLTTAPTPGHAMKAGDPLKAFGTVIGKALRPLAEGKGLIPILIALQ